MEAIPKGKLFLIPIPLGDNEPLEVLPITVQQTLKQIDTFIVENEKTARRFIKKITPEKPQSTLQFSILNKHTDFREHSNMLQPCLEGTTVGLMSEAGCPGVADPGAVIVKLAHEKGIQVVPLVGPSSILLAMMASGLNGQCFAFNGYLPIDKSEKKTALKNWERISFERNQSQLFIETPYRNTKLMDELLQTLHPTTLLCVATDITLPTEEIKTYRVADWKKHKINLEKRPTLFIIHKLA